MNTAIYPFLNGSVTIQYEGEICYAITPCYPAQEIDNPIFSDFSDAVYAQLAEYAEGKRKTFDIPYKLEGTDFQLRVWHALADIPYGETCSYKDIAEAVGSPKAFRAVGMANNKNPISIILPCHRVIGASGKLVGYGGGLEMKQALLDLEQRYR